MEVLGKDRVLSAFHLQNEHSVLYVVFKSSCNRAPHIFQGKEFYVVNISLRAFTTTVNYFLKFFRNSQVHSAEVNRSSLLPFKALQYLCVNPGAAAHSAQGDTAVPLSHGALLGGNFLFTQGEEESRYHRVGSDICHLHPHLLPESTELKKIVFIFQTSPVYSALRPRSSPAHFLVLLVFHNSIYTLLPTPCHCSCPQ